jgi:carboxypeptidase family protein/TonB-dependent receptor-like protein
MDRVLRRAGVLVCLALIIAAGPALAQVRDGEIFGKVTDESGAVLPGVNVTITGPALIQPLSTVTSESGAYRFPKIPIGTYTVTFELTGFKKLVRSDVVIQAGFNAAIDARLGLSTVQETVTVTGESPVVDTRSTTLAQSFTREALEKIPSARDPWVMIEQTPGVIMSGTNVGGNLSGQQTSFSAFGSGSNTQWNLDGAVISDIASGNSSPTYYDFDSFEEIQITTGGSDASQQGAGVQVNFITKSGGNQIRGSGRFFDTNRKFENNNVTSTLRDLGAAGGNPIQDIQDYGLEIGGPIKKNRAWYWVSGSKNDIDVGVVNFFDKSTANCAAIAESSNAKDANGNYQYSVPQIWDCLQTDNTQLVNYNAKFQFQENSGNKSTFFWNDGIKTRNSRGADAFHPLITTRRQDGPTYVYRAEHQWIASSRLTMTLQYTHMDEDWGLFRQSDDLKDVQAINYVDTSFWDRSTSSADYHTIRPQDDISADGNYFLSNFLGGDHSMKFGFRYRRSPVESLSQINGGAVVRIRDASSQPNCTVAGVTGPCNEANITRDGDYSYILNARSLYWSDSYKTGRLTINGGLRFDRQFDIARATEIPANRILPDLLPSVKFAGADSGARYNDLSPRGGFTFDLRGNAKSIVKVNAGRYYGLGMSTADTLEPTTPTTLRYAWRDLNGDTVVQRNELDLSRFLTTPSSNYDPANPSAVTTPATVDPNLKNDITDEFIAGFDHELMNNFGVGISYIHRKYHQFQGTYRTDPGDTTESYTPVTITRTCGNPVACGNETFTGTYYQRSTPLHSGTILRNNGQYNTYNGLELTARKRFSNHWMLTTSLVRNNQIHYEPMANRDYLDPTNHEFINGFEDGTRNGKWVGKISGMYQFPWGITAAAKIEGHTSYPYNRNILSPNRTGSLGTVSILVEPNNSRRYPTLYEADIHADKAFGFGSSRRFSLNFDLFNITNSNTILARVVRQNSSTGNNVTTILAPRVARFGIKVNF